MTVTHDPRFAVNIYGSGSDPWMGRVGFNQLIGLITAGAVKGAQGVSGDRPTAGIDRRLYLATDTKRLYWDTGSEWVEVSPVGGGPDTAAVTVGGAYIAGSSRIAARSDHGHAMPAPAADPAAETFGAAADRGSSPTPARADHKHAMPAMPLSAVAPVANAFGTAAVVGTSTNVARADHKHATPSVAKAPQEMLLGAVPSNPGDLRIFTRRPEMTTDPFGYLNIPTSFTNGVAYMHVHSIDSTDDGYMALSAHYDISDIATIVWRATRFDGSPITNRILRLNVMAVGW